MNPDPFHIIAILGPTATGKTRLAAALACRINGEIISADSRQVYKGLDIGTGKDLDDYKIEGKAVPYHLIDIVDVNYEYNLFDFQQDFLTAYKDIRDRGKIPILCGGTALYMDSVLKRYNLRQAPVDEELRSDLSGRQDEELISMLASYKMLHNKTDTEERERLIRAIEIAKYESQHPGIDFPEIRALVIGVHMERQAIRERITSRLKDRLNKGMVGEVQRLLDIGVPAERLFKLGLEYRYIAFYLLHKINYNDMFQKLNSSIHAFAKRQMTWYRKMEREGIKIHWIDGSLSLEEKVKKAANLL